MRFKRISPELTCDHSRVSSERSSLFHNQFQCFEDEAESEYVRVTASFVQEWVEVEEPAKKKKKKKKKKSKSSAPVDSGAAGTAAAGADDGAVSQPVAA